MSNLVTRVRTVLHACGVDVVRYRPDKLLPADFSEKTCEIWYEVQPFTMASPERIATLCDAVRYIETNRIPGAIVECGVWRGGSMMAAAKTLLDMKSTQRELFYLTPMRGCLQPRMWTWIRLAYPPASCSETKSLL